MIRESQLLYQDQTEVERVLELARPGYTEQDGVFLSQRVQAIPGGEIVYATVENRNSEPVRLKWLSFEVDTGYDPSLSIRFFKHGYQSWSASYPAVIGDSARPQTRSLLARISHQSEAQRPETAPENVTSELFTILESDSSPVRLLCGFIGAANQFTTLTASLSRVTARALFDFVWLRRGEKVTVEPLVYWRSKQEPARMLVIFERRLLPSLPPPVEPGDDND